jgi:hypothetical protein
MLCEIVTDGLQTCESVTDKLQTCESVTDGFIKVYEGVPVCMTAIMYGNPRV